MPHTWTPEDESALLDAIKIASLPNGKVRWPIVVARLLPLEVTDQACATRYYEIRQRQERARAAAVAPSGEWLSHAQARQILSTAAYHAAHGRIVRRQGSGGGWEYLRSSVEAYVGTPPDYSESERHWTQQEDEALEKHVARYGEGRWGHVAGVDRSGNAAMKRWARMCEERIRGALATPQTNGASVLVEIRDLLREIRDSQAALLTRWS